MNIFSTILQKLGIQKPAAASKPYEPVSSPLKPYEPVSSTPQPAASASAPASGSIEVVDVVSKLEKMASGSGLDWKVSIVDMLKLLDMDSSLNARKQLATELGCPTDLIGGDYAKMNVWLHQTVLQKIAENGGNIPQSLLKK